MAGVIKSYIHPVLQTLMNGRGFPTVYSLAKRVAFLTGRHRSTVIRTITGNKHEYLLSYWNLSRALGITMDTLAMVLIDTADPAAVILELSKTRDIKNFRQLSIAANMGQNQLYDMTNGKQKHVAIYNYKPYADVLGISFEDFTRLLLESAHLNGLSQVATISPLHKPKPLKRSGLTPAA